MSEQAWKAPKPESPKDMSFHDFLVETLGYFYNVMIASWMLIMVIATCAIMLFLITLGVALFCQFVVAISNPIPFIEQF